MKETEMLTMCVRVRVAAVLVFMSLAGCELPPLSVGAYGPDVTSYYGVPVAIVERESGGTWVRARRLDRAWSSQATENGDVFCHWTFYGSSVPEGATVGFVLPGTPGGEQILITGARGAKWSNGVEKRRGAEDGGVWEVFEAVPDEHALLPEDTGNVPFVIAASDGVVVSLGAPVERMGSAWVPRHWVSVAASMRTSSGEWSTVPCALTSCGGWALTIPAAGFSGEDPLLYIKAEAHEEGPWVAMARVPKVLRERMLVRSRGAALGLLLPWRRE